MGGSNSFAFGRRKRRRRSHKSSLPSALLASFPPPPLQVSNARGSEIPLPLCQFVTVEPNRKPKRNATKICGVSLAHINLPPPYHISAGVASFFLLLPPLLSSSWQQQQQQAKTHTLSDPVLLTVFGERNDRGEGGDPLPSHPPHPTPQ